MYVQTWKELKELSPDVKQKYKNTITTNVSKEYVMRAISGKKSSLDTILRICKFLSNYKFATEEQLCSYLQDTNIKGELEKLVGWHIINKCVFYIGEEPKSYPVNEIAFQVYSFDIGGKYIMENYNDDVNDINIVNWRISDLMGSTPYIVDKIQLVNIYLEIQKCDIDFNLRPRPNFQARERIKPSFMLITDNGIKTNYIGYCTISSKNVPTNAMSIEHYCSILNSLLTEQYWKKYFTDNIIPIPMFIFSSDRELVNLGKIIAVSLKPLREIGVVPVYSSFTRILKNGLTDENTFWTYDLSLDKLVPTPQQCFSK